MIVSQKDRQQRCLQHDYRRCGWRQYGAMASLYSTSRSGLAPPPAAAAALWVNHIVRATVYYVWHNIETDAAQRVWPACQRSGTISIAAAIIVQCDIVHTLHNHCRPSASVIGDTVQNLSNRKSDMLGSGHFRLHIFPQTNSPGKFPLPDNSPSLYMV